jgi:hypothetical protein
MLLVLFRFKFFSAIVIHQSYPWLQICLHITVAQQLISIIYAPLRSPAMDFPSGTDGTTFAAARENECSRLF